MIWYHEQKIWREDVSEKSFYPFEVSIIKNIPLCRTIQEDVLIWPFNPDGIYSVKSGYKFLYEEHLGKQLGPSENEALKPLWKEIWGLNVLAWKACKDSQPTKVNLVHRKIITTSGAVIGKVFSSNHSLNHKKRKVQGFWGRIEVEPRSNCDDVIINLIIN